MSATIKVAVRPRPLDDIKKEKWAPGFEIHGRRLVLGSRTFDPDVTLPPTASQDDVFEHCVPILDSVKDGANGTIMVYGQTGTGKTHTMIGSEKNDGVAFRSIEYLLKHVCERTMEGAKLALSLSMLEIYNERITDMLSDEQSEVQLISGFPRNVKKVTLSQLSDAVRTVRLGLSFRHVAPTVMNERSSRSHVILMLDLEVIMDGPSSDGASVSSTIDITHLFLVDLAGSESIKKSQAVGKVASEAGMINRSLLALKNVILTLSNAPENSRPPHIPYRDSKLTELLQDSIGGTARTMLIACISPVGRDLEETKSTLDYASKARTIRNVAGTERDKLTVRIRSLEIELQRWKNKVMEKVNERGGCFVTKEELDRQAAIEEEHGTLKQEIETLISDRKHTDARQHITESTVAIYKTVAEEKDKELQEFKAKYIEAMQTFEKSSVELQRENSAAMEGLEHSLRTEQGVFSEKVQDWLQKLRFTSTTKWSQEIREQVEIANRRVLENNRAFIGTQKLYSSDVRDLAKENTERMNSVVAAFDLLHQEMLALRRFYPEHEARTMRRTAEMEQQIEQYSSQLPAPCYALPFEHVLSNAIEEISNEAKAEFTIPHEPVGELMERIRAARHVGRRLTRETLVEAMSGVGPHRTTVGSVSSSTASECGISAGGSSVGAQQQGSATPSHASRGPLNSIGRNAGLFVDPKKRSRSLPRGTIGDDGDRRRPPSYSSRVQ